MSTKYSGAICVHDEQFKSPNDLLSWSVTAFTVYSFNSDVFD